MKNTDIIVFAAVTVFLVFRLYQKYGKKGSQKKNQPTGKKTFFKNSGLAEQPDDYEPYSKKGGNESN